MNGTLPAGDESQTPDQYVRALCATTGMPHVLVRRNMEKIRGVLDGVETVLGGLTREVLRRSAARGVSPRTAALAIAAERAAAL